MRKIVSNTGGSNSMAAVFETIFRIPVHHRLVVTSSRSRGGRAHGVRWFHDERIPTSRLATSRPAASTLRQPQRERPPSSVSS
jgi:hypothetical protein